MIHLTWQPIKKKNFASGSKLAEICTQLFGPFPVELNIESVSKLEAIVACGYTEMNELIDAIYKHGCIMLDSQV